MVLHNTLAEIEVWSGLAICPRHASRYCQDLQALKYLPMRSIDHPATVTSLRSTQIASDWKYANEAQEVMPPLTVGNRWVRILRGLEVVKVSAATLAKKVADLLYNSTQP